MTDNSPELPGLRALSGNEPELSAARPKCPECGVTMQMNLVGAWLCMPCLRVKHQRSSGQVTKARIPSDPVWFNATKNTPTEQIRQVRAGRHPMGSPLLPDNDEARMKTCGTCMHLYEHRSANTYFKCTQHEMTHGPGSDVRKGWAACNKYQNED